MPQMKKQTDEKDDIGEEWDRPAEGGDQVERTMQTDREEKRSHEPGKPIAKAREEKSAADQVTGKGVEQYMPGE